MSGGVAPLFKGVIAALNDGGVVATEDPSAATPPCVVASLGPISHDLLNGAGDATILLDLVVSDIAPLDALDDLDSLLAKVLTIVDTSADTVPQVLLLPGATSPLPSFRLTCTYPFEPYQED